jgi:hypothetical protein
MKRLFFIGSLLTAPFTLLKGDRNKSSLTKGVHRMDGIPMTEDGKILREEFWRFRIYLQHTNKVKGKDYSWSTWLPKTEWMRFKDVHRPEDYLKQMGVSVEYEVCFLYGRLPE